MSEISGPFPIDTTQQIDVDNREWALTNYIIEQLPMVDPKLYDPDKLISYLRHFLLFRLSNTDPPDWVTTKVFAICFYHGLYQTVYHALKTFVLIDEKKVRKEKSCLWIEWNDQSVSIFNRGGTEIPEDRFGDFKSNGREFFDIFQQKADEFC